MIDLLLVGFVSIVAAAAAMLGEPALSWGTLSVAFCPGYAAVSALFPRRDDMGLAKRIALGSGLSIAVVPIVALVPHYYGPGLTLYPVAISLLAITFGCLTVAWQKRLRLPTEDRAGLSVIKQLRNPFSWLPAKRCDKALVPLLVLSTMAVFITMAYVIINPKPGEKSTEFYILGANGQAADYPQQLTLGSPAWVTVGIVNHERETTTYSMKVVVEGHLESQIDGILVPADGKWEQQTSFVASTAGTDQKVEFLLFKHGQTEASSRLHLWIDVVGR